jgi:methyl-accepting chemotaxis protein
MKTLLTKRLTVILVVIPATLLMAGISAYSSIVSHQAVFEACKQRDLIFVANLIQADLQEQMNKAAAIAAMVVNSPSVQNDFRAGNRQRILDRLLPEFLIQRDRYGVLNAQFHTAPATTFLRIYASEGESEDESGEDQSSFREMVVSTNKEHEPRKGVEIGRQGISIRGIDLVKDAEGYIGSFEVGMSFMYILEDVKNTTGFEAGAFVDDALMSRIATALPKPDAERIVAGFRNVEATNWKVIKSIVTPELLTSTSDIKMELKTIAGIDYGIVIVPLLDYKGINIGSIIATQEFEAYQNQMNAAIVRAIAFSLLQVLVLAGIIIVMINVMFVRPAATTELPK